ncbi:CPBP family intramembrane glutamic endopeptidase [Nocardiopsis halophila]|uniref:CPBP family intramembrane glutamic endopeptidase n=1 Tax=Nocardiopsis halophila TaxID=141692 RepID=UPI00034A6522|nr:CPBP family intramembrane glutamic endopeptidase [Nocardiopsis halophila]
MRNTPPPSDASWSSEPSGREQGREPLDRGPQAWAGPPDGAAAEGGRPVWAWPPPEPPRPANGPARARPGTPYHRLARTWRFRWWIPPLALLVGVLLVLLTQIVMYMAAAVYMVLQGRPATGESPFGAEVPDLAFMLIVLATMTPIALLVARTVQWRPFGSLMSVEGRLRGRWLGVCALVALPVLALYLGLLYTLQLFSGGDEGFVGAFVGMERFLPALVVILLLVPFQASAEEVALRGFLMQAVGSYGRPADHPRGGSALSRLLRTPVPAILVSGTVFALMHDYTDWALLDVAVFGVAVAWLTWYTGGLEAAIGLHVVHNLVAFVLTAYEGGLADAATGSGSWAGVAGTTAEVLVYSLVVALLARRMGIRRTVPGDPEDHPEPPARRRLPHWVMQPPPAGPASSSGAPGAPGAVGGVLPRAALGDGAPHGTHFQTPPPGPYPGGHTAGPYRDPPPYGGP